jgi:hypothetical protein
MFFFFSSSLPWWANLGFAVVALLYTQGECPPHHLTHHFFRIALHKPFIVTRLFYPVELHTLSPHHTYLKHIWITPTGNIIGIGTQNFDHVDTSTDGIPIKWLVVGVMVAAGTIILPRFGWLNGGFEWAGHWQFGGGDQGVWGDAAAAARGGAAQDPQLAEDQIREKLDTLDTELYEPLELLKKKARSFVFVLRGSVVAQVAGSPVGALRRSHAPAPARTGVRERGSPPPPHETPFSPSSTCSLVYCLAS